MKTTKPLFLLLALLAITISSVAQTVRPVSADKPHAVFVQVGLNQAIIAGSFGYQRSISEHYQLVLGVDAAAVPKFLTNSRVYAGLQRNLLESGHFVLPLRLLGSTALADNQLYKAVNVSTELSLHPQLHYSGWTYGIDVHYRQGWATHLKHSTRYRSLAHPGAVDGWYRYPASTFRLGASIAYLFKATEIGLQVGYQSNGKYDMFLPPLYGVLMTSFRF